MKVDTIISRLEGLESWLKRNGFPGAKPAETALHEAIKLLKPDPVEPISHYNKLLKETLYWCGKCERNLQKGDHYCPKCGRPVKWNE